MLSQNDELILRELRSALSSLPEGTEEALAQALLIHRRVFFCGAGRSGLMLRALAMRLAQMGRCTYVAGETVTPAIEKGDLLVAASASGKTAGVVNNARIAREAGADVLVITAAADGPLAALGDGVILLNAGSKERASGEQVMGSLFEQALLILGDGAVQQMNADGEAMRRRHANLE